VPQKRDNKKICTVFLWAYLNLTIGTQSSKQIKVIDVTNNLTERSLVATPDYFK